MASQEGSVAWSQ